LIRDKNAWGVTVELHMEYKKPVPLNEELRVVGRITKDSKRLFEGSGEILLANGDIAVKAYGKYMKVPIDKIADFNEQNEEWKVELSDKDPVEIEI
jgi:acyl-CoA thioesterase FadM